MIQPRSNHFTQLNPSQKYLDFYNNIRGECYSSDTITYLEHLLVYVQVSYRNILSEFYRVDLVL